MRLLLIFLFIYNINIQAYDMGRGYEIDDKLHLGGYFSTDYQVSKNERVFRLDDVAILAYGNFNDKLSYLCELEAAPVYTHEYKTATTTRSLRFHKERLYLDYKHTDTLNFRIGKQITPIGYWNLEPINVLRDTSSNPLFSNQMFPKFISGVDIYGYLPGYESIRYHLFGQNNKDLDENYINIKNEHFFGLSVENEENYNFQYGGSLGEFITDDAKRSRFLQANLKYDTYPFTFQSEMMYSTIKNNNGGETDYKIAAYIQSLYQLDIKNAIVGRYEYFKDSELNSKQHIGVLGYSYRPIYSVSLKGEYQLNSDSGLNKFIISFSVLF